MLAFKMKKPTQQMGLERMLSSKVDTERWGPQGVEFIKKCDAMRERVREASRSFSEKGADECREVMGRYQAVVFQTAFVCQGVNLKALQLGFKWADAFEADEQTVVHDWTFERASVLFNLAASISFLATHCDRQTPDGLKQACGLYQQAAGALSAVQAIVKDAGWSASADLSSDTLHALESLMLAQAQKCFFEKAEIDGMSTKVLAMLTAECAHLYEEVGLLVENAKQRSRPISAMSSDWLDVVQWNRYLFDGLQHYHQAKLDEADNAYGKALSRLTYATDRTATAVNACSGANPALQELFKKHYAICKEAHTKAKKDNDLVHYDKVPDVKTLPKPERKRMVKAQPPPEVALAEEPTPLPTKAASAPPAAAPQAAAPVDVVTAQAAAVDLSAPPPSMEAADAAAVAELVAMGFTPGQAQEALRKGGGSVQSAAELLLQEAAGGV